ncbi:MAG: tetratricopeptide repeat protein, partial [Deltaproteobacteria bacterium]|nr:tetratricopeptide repeat protein [Deltaproteobacteria bacterium]
MALNLYEIEIKERPIKDNIYELAREGYIRKSISSGEYLFRLGEIQAAMSRFRELIDYDYTIVEAHRGYIKCAAALHSVEEVLPVYRERMEKNPEDPVAIYGTALLLTYLENRKSALESKVLLEKAININGQIEYFHQTIGYLFEVLETVYGEENNLERALESYKKAYFLNNYDVNPDNRAHLDLNIGNIYFNLGQYRQALLFYTERLEEGVPFDNEDTEILFYKRLGASAFQVGDNRKTIMAFSKAITLIKNSVAPRETIRVFEKIHRDAMDQIITPSSYQEKLKKKALREAGSQAEISRNLAQLSEGLLPPPSPQWYEFRDKIKILLQKQEDLFPDLISLLAELQKDDVTPETASQNFELYASKVRKSLEHPLRLIKLEAEMTDRLGLAFQEDGNWEKASDYFEKAFALNQKLGLNQNLAKNRR